MEPIQLHIIRDCCDIELAKLCTYVEDRAQTKGESPVALDLSDDSDLTEAILLYGYLHYVKDSLRCPDEHQEYPSFDPSFD